MAVRIRLKKMGRRHRPFFRVCAMDSRTPRDGRVIEELGYYDPMVRDTDARAVLDGERIDYWISVGATPSDKVGVLIKKYGTAGTHLEQQQAALDKLKSKKAMAPLAKVAPPPEPESETPAEEAEATEEAPADAVAEEPAAEAPAAEEATAEAPAAEEAAAKEPPAEEKSE